VLSFLYGHGHTAVWLFFCLSGFAFLAVRRAHRQRHHRVPVFCHPALFMPLHLATLLPLSFASYRLFEMPVQALPSVATTGRIINLYSSQFLCAGHLKRRMHP